MHKGGNLHNTELLTSGIVSLIGLYLTIRHAFGKRYTVNRVFAIANLVISSFFCVTGVLLWSESLRGVVIFQKLVLAIGLVIVQMAFHFAQVYPRWERSPSPAIILLSALPAVLIIAFLFSKDYFQALGAVSASTMRYVESMYQAGIAGYAVAGVASLLYKTKYLNNEAFRSQILQLSGGYAFSIAVFIIGSYAAPKFFHISLGDIMETAGACLLWMIIVNHALVHEKTLDLSIFYREIAFWIIFCCILAVPAYFIMYLGRREITAGNPIPVEGVAVMIFLFLFLAYRFMKPLLQRVITRGNALFENTVNEFFESIAQVTSEEKGEAFWDVFLENTILPLETRFGIEAASLYMITAEGKYELGYGFGKKLYPGEIIAGNDIYECLTAYGRTVHISFFYSDEMLQPFLSVREKMRSAGIVVMLPFFNQERRLIGVLCLGQYKGGIYYTQQLLNFFETYRIQFELSLSNALMLEDVKRIQLQEHERLVIRSIKKRLIPVELPTIEGVRISSFYVDNSDLGGDYLDAVVLGRNKVGLFMCDASDAGVESGVLLLQLYSVLHNQPEKWDAPDGMLNIMNWVVATSRYTKQYVPALYCIYENQTKELSVSGAAFNPITLYDIKKDEFVEYDAKGVPLGIEKNYSYETKKIKVTGDTFGFMYSDGITSAVNRNGIGFSIGRIKDLIRLNKDNTPAILARKIYTDFISFTKGTKMNSDASVLIFKIGS